MKVTMQTENQMQTKDASKKKIQARNVNGILLLDKPIGMSSNAALQTVKRLYNAKKAGHTGSLDPLASGMLPICFGEATKFSQYLLDTDKRYRVICKLGITTATGDAEGDILQRREVPDLTKKQVEKILQQFRGEIEQVPSMYSAIKQNGEPLYKLARQGITVERKARAITIYDLEIINLQKDVLELDIHASKGTYVRTLVADIGELLGCGAYITNLHRTSVGQYATEQMHSLESLQELAGQSDFAALDALLLPIETMFIAWSDLILTDITAHYLMQGQPVIVPRAPSSGWIKLKNQFGAFLGVGEVLEDGRIAPRRLVVK
jgi:tRNA pseudouridine55 synthase